jgi:predicted small metal-binding protein
MEKQRKVIDCRWFPGETSCSLCITGTEDEVLKAAADHAVSSHGYKDTPELWEELREIIQNEGDEKR